MAKLHSRLSADRLRYLPGGPYWARTQEPLNCLVFILPIVVAYEIGVATIGTDLLARNQMQNFLSRFGATAQHLPAALVITVLLAWHVLSRRRWRVDATVLVGMLLESALLALPLLCIGLLSQRLAVAAATAMPGSALTGELLAGLGAGIYEEFLFRLVGLNLLSLILLDVLDLPKNLGYLLAATICAGLFAIYHFPAGRIMVWPAFVLYFLAGCYLAAVYIFRGFGVAVGAHIGYNLLASLLKSLN